MDAQVTSPRKCCPLPNEVLLLIFSEFLITLNPDPYCGPFDIIRWTLRRYRDLSNICKASKQLKAVAQPLLYRFLLTFPYHRGVDKVLGSMSNNPQLGELVEDFDLRYTLDTLRWDSRHGEWFRQARPCLKLPPELADQIESVLSEVLNHYTMEARDALTAFWLALMPNLKKLSLSMMDETELTCALLKHAVESTEKTSIGTRPLSSLQDLSFTQAPYKKEKPIYIAAIESLFKLPSLKTLRTSNVHWTQPDNGEAFVLPTTTCSLEHLDSRSSKMPIETVKSVLMACKELRTLKLGIRLESSPGVFPVSYDLGKILRDHGQNIERVSLSFYFTSSSRGNGEWLTGEEYLARKIGDLRCLSKLKHFGLNLPDFGEHAYQWRRPNGPLPPLMNLTEMLPRSLESLVLRCGFCDKQALVENLNGLFAAREMFPNLWCVMLSSKIKLERDLIDLGWAWKTAEMGDECWKWKTRDVGPYGLLVMKRTGVKHKFDMKKLDEF
ncbi:hypothetical protein LCI18_007486 [Fusarium solani-melongenae]|uniref:Uncharacterized protein n=1 Tax=Fusarium solani subsp. cucurbitae TaxID=2747967 RepID=A0ACD3Z5S0_FUSSC|nr:hypothetical protein LCI18_007486 [Fusarium solani-melongenae]